MLAAWTPIGATRIRGRLAELVIDLRPVKGIAGPSG
jgi:hypothetical protein